MEESKLNLNNTMVVKNGNSFLSEILYFSTEDEMLLSISDMNRGLFNKIMNFVTTISRTNSFVSKRFVVKTADKEPLFTIKKKAGISQCYELFHLDGEMFAVIRSSSNWRFEMEVLTMAGKIGIIQGETGWWTYDSPDGIRYVDYKKDSYLPEYKGKTFLTGPNVVRFTNSPDDELNKIALAVPLIIDLNQQQ
ncbi:hypothetical protein [Pseudalkalibacillus sp. SCS-8]|uniref:hypothetical protein n=1 Tax=Pseudalkalibacillus nanhaiensis TaxID=3115291 RepID=UPI0032DB76E9